MVDQQHLINITKAIEKGTKVTTLDELKSRGLQQVKVINAGKIMELIKEAVDMAIETMTGAKLGVEREKLQAAAKREFDDLMRKYQETQKTKGEIEGQASKMQAEIDAVQAMLRGGGDANAAQMGLAGLSGQIGQIVQKLQASEKARIEAELGKKRLEVQIEELKKSQEALQAEKTSVADAGQKMQRAVDEAYRKIDDAFGAKAREMGLIPPGPEPRTPEEKMARLEKIAAAAMAGLEKERAEKQAVQGQSSSQGQQLQKVQQELAQAQAKRSAAEQELAELQEFKKKLEEKVDATGSQFEEIHKVMASIGKRADDLIQETVSGRLKHLKPEEKKIITDAMNDLKADLKKVQDERAFLEKKLFYMSMTIDSLEAELLAAKGLTPSIGGSAHLKDDGLVITFDEAGISAM